MAEPLQEPGPSAAPWRVPDRIPDKDPARAPIPALLWRGLSIRLGPDRTVDVPDAAVHPGGILLATHHLPAVLRTLAGWCAAVDLDHGGEIRWDGRTLGPRAAPGQRLERFRRVAMVNSRSALLTGWSLVQNICLDLEYNQGCQAGAARALAEARIRGLGLGRLLDAPGQGHGSDRGLSLMAAALARRPALVVLDRPRSWLGEEGLAAALEAVRLFPAAMGGAEAGGAEAGSGLAAADSAATVTGAAVGSGSAGDGPGRGPRVLIGPALDESYGAGPDGAWPRPDPPEADGDGRTMGTAGSAGPAVVIFDHSRRAYPEGALDAELDLEGGGGEAGR
jgi:hypothetical protein